MMISIQARLTQKSKIRANNLINCDYFETARTDAESDRIDDVQSNQNNDTLIKLDWRYWERKAIDDV